MMAPYKGTKVVTYHRSFPNFAERFGLDIIGYVEPRPGIPPTPQHTLDLINEMKRQNVKLVLVEPYFDLKTPNAIGRETGAQVLVMPPSVGGVKEVTDYFKLFDYDINLLVDAMQEEQGEVESMDSRDAGVPGGAVRRQPDPDGHSRLPRRPRRRARRDLRRSVARADRGARRDDRDPAARSPAAIRTRRSSTGSAWRSRSSARSSSRRSAASARGFRRRRSSASATPWRRRRRFSR